LKGDWEQQRKALGRNRRQDAGAIRSESAGVDSDAPDHHASKDLEETYGFTGGQIFHGELALDQFFTMRPLLDWARYKTPIENLYLCGSGTHPGTGLTGGSGANAAREILKQLRKYIPTHEILRHPADLLPRPQG
jgi:phytoene dehydrogenase-like protein